MSFPYVLQEKIKELHMKCQESVNLRFLELLTFAETTQDPKEFCSPI